jgi:hypothetical protein
MATRASIARPSQRLSTSGRGDPQPRGWRALGIVGVLAGCTSGAGTSLGEAPESDILFDWSTLSGRTSQRMAALQEQQRRGGTAYSLVQDAAGAIEGRLPAAALRVRHDASGTRLGRIEGAWDLGFRVGAIGCERSERSSVSALVAHGNLAHADHRLADGVRYQAWYLSGPLGLEHGLTFFARPSDCATSSRLRIEVMLDASRAIVHPLGKSAVLRTASGSNYAYGELAAVDVTGRLLESWLRASPSGLLIEVDLSGAEFPVYVDPLVTTAQAKLVADDAAADEYFGHAVAVSGNRVVVGARFEDRPNLTDAGAAYVFVHNGNSWEQEAKLVASDAATADRFGSAVAIDGDTIVVGATDDDDPDQSGSAYVFVRSSVWSEQAKLRADAPSPSGQFGVAVAVQGDRAAVGAYTGQPVPSDGTFPGYAYVYTRSGTTWSFETRLSSGTPTITHIGESVALDGDWIAVGAPYSAPGGSVHLFELVGASWTRGDELVPQTIGANENFGASVALDGSLLLVGAPGEGGAPGRAFAFENVEGSWGGEDLIANTTDSSGFGRSVALDGETAVIGGFNPGDALVIQRESGNWDLGSSLELPDVALPFSVALDDGVIVVGVPADTDEGLNAGAAHVFVIEDKLALGEACASGDECASGYCVDEVCCDGACGGDSEEDCQACAVPAGAVVDGECAVRANGDTCRPSSGTCDVAEACDGVDTECPANTVVPAGEPCVDGNACTENDACDGAGNCTSGAQVICTDDNACTEDACEPEVGCITSQAPEGTSCQDGFCQDGGCADAGEGGASGAGGGGVSDAGVADASSAEGSAGSSVGTGGSTSGEESNGGSGAARDAGGDAPIGNDPGGVAGGQGTSGGQEGCGCRVARRAAVNGGWFIGVAAVGAIRRSQRRRRQAA